ncbi:hypothetical protein RRG08_053702 [Elysia crispata]|uniref:Uncharacterized protein n=1 Tax=Elysia crispata TaxID=231223 RepID=A0AAE0ZT91_9GAST|nr:hypothetical protein RRG08_053702 [Elysia crispata]
MRSTSVTRDLEKDIKVYKEALTSRYVKSSGVGRPLHILSSLVLHKDTPPYVYRDYLDQGIPTLLQSTVTV